MVARNRVLYVSSCLPTNDLCKIEMLEIELFDHSTMCKQSIDVLIELLVIPSSTWNH